MVDQIIKFFIEGGIFKKELRPYSLLFALLLAVILLWQLFINKGSDIKSEVAIPYAILTLIIILMIYIVARKPNLITSIGAHIIVFAFAGLALFKSAQSLKIIPDTAGKDSQTELINSNVRLETVRCDTGGKTWSTSPTLEANRVNYCKFRIFNFTADKPSGNAILTISKDFNIKGQIKYFGEYTNTKYLKDQNDRMKFYKPKGPNASLKNEWFVVMTINLTKPGRNTSDSAEIAISINDDKGKEILTEKIQFGFLVP